MARMDHRAKEDELLNIPERVIIGYLFQKLNQVIDQLNILRSEHALAPLPNLTRADMLQDLKQIWRNL